MKIRTLSLLSLLAALGCGVGYASEKPPSDPGFLAPGVIPGDLIASERFYDSGKGYFYWATNQGTVQSLYENSGNNWEFIGELSDYIPNGRTPADSSGDEAFYSELINDQLSCWYNVGSNLLQYWQTYYGVFYRGKGDAGNGDTTLPHGYTYDKDNLYALGGTQSLRINMFFYDNWKDVAGNIPMSTSWYLTGNNSNGNKIGEATAGFFQEYFSEQQSACVNVLQNFSLKGLRNILIDGFGIATNGEGSPVQNGDGSLMQRTVGQLVEFDIFADGGGGHAVTCYGFDLDTSGNLSAVYLANSDDGFYSLQKVYVKEENGGVYLYSDMDHTDPWMQIRWRVGQIGYIKTPECLQKMYAQYADVENPLVWNGNRAGGSVWTAADADKATLDVLPTEAAGWDIRVDQGSFRDIITAIIGQIGQWSSMITVGEARSV